MDSRIENKRNMNQNIKRAAKLQVLKPNKRNKNRKKWKNKIIYDHGLKTMILYIFKEVFKP
jgi:hypothetical protein